MPTSTTDRARADSLAEMVLDARRRYAASRPASAAAHVRASTVLPGGNTRSVLHFDPFPFRVATARGAELVDIDGHRYVDFCGDFTAGLLGHSPPVVRDAVVGALDGGWTYGATHEREAELAELLCARFESIEQVRFTNSGTEANLMAIATALHHTGRSDVLVFDRAYHGGVLSFGADPAGPHHPLNVPHRFRVGRFDDVADLVRHVDGELGCALVEPVQGSGGCRPASTEFLAALRARCDEVGAVLVFDEVMTSRLGPGGAQGNVGVIPDMTTLGKYVGGGMSFGAFGGRREIMSAFDPAQGGALTQAGTFNNNVVSTSAAIATLREELDDDRLRAVNQRGDRLRAELNELLQHAELPMWVTGLGSMLCLHSDDDRLIELLFLHLLEGGAYIARRGFVALSMAVTDTHVEDLVDTTGQWAAATAAALHERRVQAGTPRRS